MAALGGCSFPASTWRAPARQTPISAPWPHPRPFAGQTFIAIPDCWWPDAGVAAEVDSRAWHLSPKDWESTLARLTRISAYGITALHFTPRQVKADRNGVAVTLRRALAADRPLPHIRALPAL